MSARPAALVTGGSRGIGRGIAFALAEAGFDAIVNARHDNADVSTTLDGLEARGARAAFIQADVADIDGHARLVDEAFHAFGAIDCLVNNAGVGAMRRGDMLDITPESYDRCIDVNLRGPFFLTQRVVRRMLDSGPRPGIGQRTIVNISSANAVAPALNRAEYCISKAAMAMQSKLFALRLAETDIAVFEIRPGVIRTPMTEPVSDDYTRRIEQEGLVPMRRWGYPQDIGKAVATLATGGLPFTVGEALHIDGGLCIRHF